MVRKSALLFAAVLVLAVSAHAQFAVYGTATVERLSNIQSSPLLSSTSSPSLTYNNAVNPLGATFGAFYDLRNVGPVRLGLDLRGSIITDKRGAAKAYNANGSHIDSGLVGVRVLFHAPRQWLRPYAEGAVGIGRSNYGLQLPVSSTTAPPLPAYHLDNNFEYHVFAGLDLRASSILDIRIFEVGYGGLDPFGTNAHNYPLKSMSAGFVFHFPSGQ